MKCKTQFKSNVLENQQARDLYKRLKHEIKWHDGIRSKSGFTRKAYAVDNEEPIAFIINQYIAEVLIKMNKTNYTILGVYLNYYENGDMWTPRHTHKDTHQLVISLGCDRTLQVGKRDYIMRNGDAIIFGSSIHGVAKDASVKKARISIATFMK